MVLWFLFIMVAMAGTFVIGYTNQVQVDTSVAEIARFGFFGLTIAFTGLLLAALFRAGRTHTS